MKIFLNGWQSFWNEWNILSYSENKVCGSKNWIRWPGQPEYLLQFCHFLACVEIKAMLHDRWTWEKPVVQIQSFGTCKERENVVMVVMYPVAERSGLGEVALCIGLMYWGMNERETSRYVSPRRAGSRNPICFFFSAFRRLSLASLPWGQDIFTFGKCWYGLS